MDYVSGDKLICVNTNVVPKNPNIELGGIYTVATTWDGYNIEIEGIGPVNAERLRSAYLFSGEWRNEEGRLTVVGVNRYVQDGHAPIPTLKIDAAVEQNQVARAKALSRCAGRRNENPELHRLPSHHSSFCRSD